LRSPHLRHVPPGSCYQGVVCAGIGQNTIVLDCDPEGLKDDQPLRILGDVAREYGVSCAELTNGRRFAELVEARKEAARRLFRDGLSVTDIGRVLKRHHSTVIHYLDDVVGRKA